MSNMSDLIIIIGLPLAFLLYTKLVLVGEEEKITFKSFGVGTLALIGSVFIIMQLHELL